MPLLKELSRTSRDSFGLDSDSKESWDDWLNSFKSGVLYFFDSIDSIFISIRSILRPGVVVDRPGNAQGQTPLDLCNDEAIARVLQGGTSSSNFEFEARTSNWVFEVGIPSANDELQVRISNLKLK